eukprot:909338-Alexandrium_andersonii.AAC.1
MEPSEAVPPANRQLSGRARIDRRQRPNHQQHTTNSAPLRRRCVSPLFVSCCTIWHRVHLPAVSCAGGGGCRPLGSRGLWGAAAPQRRKVQG